MVAGAARGHEVGGGSAGFVGLEAEGGAEGGAGLGAGGEEVGETLGGGRLELALQPFERRQVVAAVAARVDSGDGPAGDGLVGGAHDAAIVREDGDGGLEHELGPTGLGGGELIAVEEANLRLGLGGGGEEGHARVVGEGVGEDAGRLEADVERVGGLEHVTSGEHHAAPQLLGADAAHVDGGARSGREALDLLAVALEAANAPPQAAGLDLDLLAYFQAAVEERAGHDGAETLDGEGAVDGEAGTAEVALRGRGVERRVEGGDEVVEALAGRRRGAHDGGSFEPGAGQRVGDLLLDEVDVLLLGEVALGDGDDAGGYVKQVEDGEMLAGLGHGAFVSGDDEEGEIDATGAGEHVLDETLVSGDVHDAYVASRWKGEPGEAEVDGEAALLLLTEAVGVDVGEGAHEGALAVVDVTSGTNDVHGRGAIMPRLRRRLAKGRVTARPVPGGGAGPARQPRCGGGARGG